MRCPRCGADNPERAKFCLECGMAVGAAGPQAPVREERKVVSVLFADLVGFTSQAERMDPEEVRALLAPYHASVRAALEHWGGTVEKFIGDAVMALFGAPIAREDDAERAVRAALQIRETLATEGRLHVRIGIATGEALVAIDARPDAGEGMAAGDVVNTAARLQAAAPVDGILVDLATARATARSIEYRDQAPVTVKGKAEPLGVREAIAARARFGVDVRQSTGVPLVGRARELELLTGALARAKDGRETQLVTLVGVPGIGKSRLVWELFSAIDRGHELIAWRQGRSLPYSERVSFWALSEIVKAETGILETDDAAEAETKLSGTVEALGLEPAETDWIVRHLRPLLGLEAEAELRGNRRAEAFSAWRRFLEALADRRPLVLVFEDLHWADDGLLDFVDHLVDWASGVPLLIVASSRPELLSRRPGWGGGKPNALTVSLPPLSDAEATRLVAALVERALVPARLREQVLERAQGNPLYAEEFARLVAEGGRLDELPESVQGIIAARLDALSREEKDLLQDAAVVGKVFWSGAIAEMRARDRHEVETLLHGLERREFVRRERRSSVAGETEYAFRHILVRDVAYGQIPRADRAERHVGAARWIESLARPTDHAELLAGHYLAALELAAAAGRPTDAFAGRARRWLLEAGDRALSLQAFPGAARYFHAALGLMADDDAERARALLRYGRALWVSEERGEPELAEAEAALRAQGDLEGAAEAAVLQAEAAWYGGNGMATAAHLARARELVDDLAPSFSKAYVLSDLSRYAMLGGRSAEAVEIGRRALALAEELGLDEVRAHALNNIGSSSVYQDDLGGLADLERALEIALAVNSPEAARVMNNLGTALMRLGELRRGMQLWRDARRAALALGAPAIARFVRANLAFASYVEGRWDEALELADLLVAEYADAATQAGASRMLRARIRFARGDIDAALEDVERAVPAARRAGDPQDIVPTMGQTSVIYRDLGRIAEADAALEEAVVVARRAPEEAGPDVILGLLAAGRTADLGAIAQPMQVSRWREIALALARDDVVAAGAIADEIGAVPMGAQYRIWGVPRLIDQRRLDEARDQLDRAAAVAESLGATRWLELIERLRASIAAAEGTNVLRR